jgi:hypothetical protein
VLYRRATDDCHYIEVGGLRLIGLHGDDGRGFPFKSDSRVIVLEMVSCKASAPVLIPDIMIPARLVVLPLRQRDTHKPHPIRILFPQHLGNGDHVIAPTASLQPSSATRESPSPRSPPRALSPWSRAPGSAASRGAPGITPSYTRNQQPWMARDQLASWPCTDEQTPDPIRANPCVSRSGFRPQRAGP